MGSRQVDIYLRVNDSLAKRYHVALLKTKKGYHELFLLGDCACSTGCREVSQELV